MEEDDEIIYTYARENERKVNYKYTDLSIRNSLVTKKLIYDKKSSSISYSSFFSTKQLSPVSITISTSPLPFPPPLSPVLIKRSNRTINNSLPKSNENHQRRRLQIVPSPPPPPSESISKHTSSSNILHTSLKSNTNSGHIRQPVLIVNSLESLVSLNERLGITLIKNSLDLTDRNGNLSVKNSTISHSRNCILNLISRKSKTTK